MQNQQKNNWIAIESDPGLWNNYLQQLGVNISLFKFQQLLSVQEEWALASIDKPVIGVILVYQETQAQIKQQIKEEQSVNFNEFEQIQNKIQNPSQKLFYMYQYANNACGSIAIYHVLLNHLNQNKQVCSSNSLIQKFYDRTINLNYKGRGIQFENNKEIKQLHLKYSQKGQSQVKQEVQEHYIAFVEYNGKLYELDGCKKGPIQHINCSSNQILQQSCEVIKQFMNRDPQNINFNVIVLCKQQ